MNRHDWDDRYRQDKLIWSAGPNQFVEREVTGLTPGTALDVGCGEGRNALWLADRGWKVEALDFSSVAIDKARARSHERRLHVHWRVADATVDINGQYDLILYLYLHLPSESMERSLSLASAALAPGGMLLIVGHDRRNLAEGIGGPQDPAILYTPQGLCAMLPSLHIERAETVTRCANKEGIQRQALDAIVRARR